MTWNHFFWDYEYFNSLKTDFFCGYGCISNLILWIINLRFSLKTISFEVLFLVTLKSLKCFCFYLNLPCFFSLFSFFSNLPLAIKPSLNSLSITFFLSFNFFIPRANLNSSKERVCLPYNKASTKCLYDLGREMT